MEQPRRFSKKGSRPAAAIADLSTTGAAGRVYAGIDIRRGVSGSSVVTKLRNVLHTKRNGL